MHRKLIESLKLKSHPEGGFFCRIYESNLQTSVPYSKEPRKLTTAIHYLLHAKQYSCWHKIQSDELWCLSTHSSEVLIHEVVNSEVNGAVITTKLSAINPSYTVKAGHWFAAELLNKSDDDFALCQCVVSPGFDFNDFSMATTKDLDLNLSPLIRQFLKG